MCSDPFIVVFLYRTPSCRSSEVRHPSRGGQFRYCRPTAPGQPGYVHQGEPAGDPQSGGNNSPFPTPQLDKWMNGAQHPTSFYLNVIMAVFSMQVILGETQEQQDLRNFPGPLTR